MTFNKQLLAVAILAQPLLAFPAIAQDEDDFEASIAFGYVGTSGNTDTDTYNTEILLHLTTEMWDHNMKFQALGSQENAQATAERYFLQNKSDYNLDENQYLYLKGTYTDDRFSGFDYQATVSGGYGRHLIMSDRFELQAFGGIGYRENAIIDAGSEGEVIFTLGEEFGWNISDNASLTQSFSTEIGEKRTVSVFELGLETNIIGDITTKIAFQARNNSDVPVGTEKTDTLTSVSLVYNF
jgi:putative salt-induced outer membrane protein YdiY